MPVFHVVQQEVVVLVLAVAALGGALGGHAAPARSAGVLYEVRAAGPLPPSPHAAVNLREGVGMLSLSSMALPTLIACWCTLFDIRL